MKKIVLLFVISSFILISSFSFAGRMYNIDGNGSGQNPGVAVINSLDTVYFDIYNATTNGSSVEFPVYIISDDSINALDFSFKYNELDLQYDTIINLTNYIQHLSYYNPNDSTVRFTSYSFTQPYSQDTALVLVRFTILAGQLCSTDLLSVEALLNGDASSERVLDCQAIGLADSFNESSIQIFPNPTSGKVNVTVPVAADLTVVDINGKEIITPVTVPANEKFELNVEQLNNGMYIILLQSGNYKVEKKLFIAK